MYAACSFVVGTVTGTRGITDFARVWVWVGAAVWTVVFAAMLRRGPALIRGEPAQINAGGINELTRDRRRTPGSG